MTTIQDQVRAALNARTEQYDREQQEREKRAKSIHSIRRSQQMEGGDISPFAQGVFARYIDGEITLSEVGAQLKAHHGVK